MDLDHVLGGILPLWESIRDRSLFITGGTGFVGSWLLASLAWADESLRLNAHATVLTRSPSKFAESMPHLAEHPAITLLEGDMRTFAYPKGRFHFIIHAASQEPANMSASGLLDKCDTDVAGTQRVLGFARHARALRLLFTSSGAVYGLQPAELERVSEGYSGTPDPCDPRTAYGRSKRMCESLCASCAKDTGIACVVARCFTFVGPMLPLNSGYAVGNFIRDALGGGPIDVRGDGSPFRSYLYSADLAIWLWTLLFSGRSCRPYNVGSADELTILELARTVARVVAPGMPVMVKREPALDRAPERYVPCVDRARCELGLTQQVRLEDALGRTASWHLQQET